MFPLARQERAAGTTDAGRYPEPPTCPVENVLDSYSLKFPFHSFIVSLRSECISRKLLGSTYGFMALTLARTLGLSKVTDLQLFLRRHS